MTGRAGGIAPGRIGPPSPSDSLDRRDYERSIPDRLPRGLNRPLPRPDQHRGEVDAGWQWANARARGARATRKDGNRQNQNTVPK